MQRNPVSAVMASVRTAEIITEGSSQHEAMLAAAHATVATVVCSPTRYRPAEEKSMKGSSWDRYTSSLMFLSALLIAMGLNLAISSSASAILSSGIATFEKDFMVKLRSSQATCGFSERVFTPPTIPILAWPLDVQELAKKPVRLRGRRGDEAIRKQRTHRIRC